MAVITAVVSSRPSLTTLAALAGTALLGAQAVAAGRLVRMGSSPDLAGLMRDAGYDDPVLAREAFIALHRSGAIEPER